MLAGVYVERCRICRRSGAERYVPTPPQGPRRSGRRKISVAGQGGVMFRKQRRALQTRSRAYQKRVVPEYGRGIWLVQIFRPAYKRGPFIKMTPNPH